MLNWIIGNYHIIVAAFCASFGWMLIVEPIFNRWMFGFDDWWKFWKMWFKK